jgi:hypothetical protein
VIHLDPLAIELHWRPRERQGLFRFWGFIQGENEGTRSGGRKWRVFKSEGSDALLVFVWALNMSEIRG